jgi:hypothetical protein
LLNYRVLESEHWQPVGKFSAGQFVHLNSLIGVTQSLDRRYRLGGDIFGHDSQTVRGIDVSTSDKLERFHDCDSVGSYEIPSVNTSLWGLARYLRRRMAYSSGHAERGYGLTRYAGYELWRGARMKSGELSGKSIRSHS